MRIMLNVNFSPVADPELLTPILNFLDGLLFLVLTLPQDSAEAKNIQRDEASENPSSLQQTYKKWQDYINTRMSIIQGGCESGSRSTFTSYLSPLVGHGFSAFRSALDSLGLSNDIDVVSLRFHLWLQHALNNKTNIGTLNCLFNLGFVKNY